MSNNSFNDEKDLKNDRVEPSNVFVRDVEEGEQDVFAQSEYHTTSWPGAAVVLLKIQVGLGVLSVPSSIAQLGWAAGVIITVFLGLVTSYSNHIVGRFKANHPSVHSMPDAAFVMWGPIGREVITVMYFLFMTFIASSSILSLSIGLNSLSLHGTCTIVFVTVASIAVYLVASIRKLEKISWLGWVGLVSLIASILTVTIASSFRGLTDEEKSLSIGPTENFRNSMVAIVNILFAYTGTPSFFSVISEMKKPSDYYKAVYAQQIFAMCFYLCIGIIIYYYVGTEIASPALGSAGLLIQRISYGLCIPSLMVSGLLYSHLAAKSIFVRALRRQPKHLNEPTVIHWIVWLSTVFGVVLFEWFIANVIPFFDNLLGLVGSLFASMFAIAFPAWMWLFDNWCRRKEDKSIAYKAKIGWNAFMILLGAFLCVAGTYGTVLSIDDNFKSGTVGSVFDCADNSNST